MTKFLSKDGKFYMRNGKLLGYTPPPPTASLTPKTGIIYTDGLPSDWNIMKEVAKAISDASSSITANTTGAIYVNNETGSLAYKITPGDTITVNSYPYAVMGFNNYELTNKANYGGNNTYAGLTFGMVDCSGEYSMNSTASNNGSWGTCLMRTSTMETLKAGMPSTMAQIRTPYCDSKFMFYSDDYMFLPAEKEVFGSRTYSPTEEADALTQYAYYKNGGSKIKNYNSSASYWWLRSARSSDSYSFCIVNHSGSASGSYAQLAQGAAPCFCI